MKKSIRIKRIMSLVLAIMVFSVCFSSIGNNVKKVVATQSNLIYEQNFDGISSLPSDWSVATGNPTGTSVNVSGGAMMIENSSTILPVAVYCNANVGNNYTVEADINILSITDGGRWAGICVRVQDTAGWYKASLCPNGSSSINCYNKTNMNGGGWVQLKNGTFLDNINLNTTYKLSVTCYGQSVSYSLNGNYVLDAEIPATYSTGGFGIVLSGAKIIVDNVKVYTATEAGQKWEANVVDPIVPETGIVNPPIVISNGKGSFATAPTASILSVNSDGSVRDSYNNSFATIVSAASALDEKTVPIYKVENKEAADKLIEYFNNHFIIDAFVLVNEENAELLTPIMAKNRYIRGVMQFDEDILTEEKAWQTVEKANVYGANVVLVPLSTPQNIVYYMQRRMVTVWTEAINQEEVINATILGVNGIVCDDTDIIYDYYRSVTETTVIRKPVVIAHRGASSLYPQNTLNGYIAAYEMGANMTEIDLYLSKDKQIVLFHDGHLDGLTNGTGPIEGYTVKELKQFTVDCMPGISETIPTFEEVIQYFIDKDMVFMLELKSEQAEMMYVLKDLLNNYNFHDHVVVMSGNMSQLKLSRELIPEVVASRGGLNEVINPIRDDKESLAAAIKEMAPYEFQPFPFWYNTFDNTWSYLYKFSAKGYLTFSSTCNDFALFDQRNMTVFGATGVLSDFSQNAKDYVYYLNATDTTIALDDLNDLEAMLVGNDGAFKQKVKYQTIDGKTITSAGNYKVVCYVDVVLPRNYGAKINYRLYSKVINLTVV